MSLPGRRIVVTRAKHQAEELMTLIANVGGIPIAYPCIEIALPDETTRLDSALQNLSDYNWIVFTSPNTVEAIQQRIESLEIIIDWQELNIAAVGSKTDSVIQEMFSKSADFVPSTYKGETLAQDMLLSGGEKILLPQSELAPDTLALELSKRGADVTVVDAYRNMIGSGGEDVPALLRQNRIDAVTFTSGSTVENFIERIAPQTAFDVPAICIGSSSATIALHAGFTSVHYPENYTIPDMVKLLSNFFEEVHDGNS